jgi:SAM-dependent methyltransferase
MLFDLLRIKYPDNLTIDNPEVTGLRKDVLKEKVFLRKIYEEWYGLIASALPRVEGEVLEVGSGPGFFQDVVEEAICSEAFFGTNTDIVMDACEMAFRPGTLRAIVLTDVLHHLPKPRSFFSEAVRCLKPAGVIIMIEPWVTSWSRFVYQRLHYEPFCETTREWEFNGTGPLSGANSALPWIVFARDRSRFEQEFPQLKVESITPMMPFRYLLSGGVSYKSLQPGCTFSLWRGIERALKPLMGTLAMFARIVITRTG